MPRLVKVNKCKPQDDRYLAALSRYERKRQERIRSRIIAENLLAGA